MNSYLTARARPDEGVVFTAGPEALTMVREAIYQRLKGEFAPFNRALFTDFYAGRADPAGAGDIFKALQNYTYFDPAIGKGVFLQVLYQELTEWQSRYDLPVSARIDRNIRGMDLDQSMIQYCNASLSFHPALVCADFITTEYAIRPDIIIANPPYIRQELLRRDYKKLLVESARQDWPELNISARSDLYVYFILKAARILADNGVMTFIVPNGWLDNDFGESLRKLFKTTMQLLSIHEFTAERHFAAAVNTVILTVIKKPVVATDRIELHSDNRGYSVSQRELAQMNLGWYGSFFRCPDWLRAVLNSNRSLLPLGDQLTIQTGIITGDNRQYYFHQKTDNTVPAIRSPREATAIEFRRSDAATWLRISAIPFKIRRAPLLWVDLRGGRHLVVWNRDDLPFEHTFYGLIPQNDNNVLKWALLLNTSWVWLMVELFGRKSLGGGAIRLVKCDLRKLPMPKIDALDFADFDKGFLSRPIGNWRAELKQRDRQALDRVVFRSLGLEDSYLDCMKLIAQLMEQREVKSKS